MKFAYFPGCTAHSTSVEYGHSTNEVLEALGVELREIEDWNCCGAAATHSLNRMLSLALPARNIAMAQRADAGPLAIPCAGCFNMLKRAEHALRHDEEDRRRIEEIVGFTFDPKMELLALLDVIVGRVGLEKVAAGVTRPLAGLKVACYYGCALVRNPEVTGLDDPENPRFLHRLMKALGAEPVEWSFGTDCCGADLALTRGEVVRELVGKIVTRAREAGASCLVTSCGLCSVNLEMRQSQSVPVFYFTELMGEAMGLPGRESWWKRHLIDPRPLLKSVGPA